METAGLLYDDSVHYLDHLAPFCALVGWPLIATEPEIAEQAMQWYPDLQVLHIPYESLRLPERVVTCTPFPLLRASFPNQSCRHLWLPHGNSDKGRKIPFFESLREETCLLIYGQQMRKLVSEKQLPASLVSIGNFRWEYAQRQRRFYQEKIKLPKGRKLLYAPTWDDAEDNNSFWNAFPKLAARIDKETTLLIKLHPNTARAFAPEIEQLIGRYSQNNLLFLPDIPPIYPILEACDGYIGDMSSIGYDFLTFNRPLFFFRANPSLPLHRCGTAILPETFDGSLQDDFAQERKALYHSCFDPSPDWSQLSQTIDALCSL